METEDKNGVSAGANGIAFPMTASFNGCGRHPNEKKNENETFIPNKK